MDTLVGADYAPAALLGTKVIAGTEYAFLVYSTYALPYSVHYFAVIFIAANADGTYEILNIVPLNPVNF